MTVKTMQDNKTPRCQAKVFDGFHSYQCRYEGKIERHGTHFCGIHDPIALEKRRQERQAVRNKASAERRLMIIHEQNANARESAKDFLDHIGSSPWLADTLSALAGLANSAERAKQFMTLLCEQLREWEQEPTKEGK
jgi:hypothetical protein